MSKLEFINYHEVDHLDFKKYIESIGFKFNGWYYVSPEFRVTLYSNCYHFFYGSEWYAYEYNDLTPFEEYFKNELRSIKLRKILG